MRAISDQCELCPDMFMRRLYTPLLNKVRHQLAAFVNADVDSCVIVGNVTTAMGTILGNLDYAEGDVLVACEF